MAANLLTAQVTFIIDSLPSYTPTADNIYIVGDFNGWDPGDSNYRLTKNDNNRFQITLDAKADGTMIQYKFTRGDWETVEKGPDGEEIDNRTFTYGNGATVHVVIYNWRDNSSGGESTAAENVHIIDNSFYMPQLDKTRRIWIYLPPDYETTDNYYPVLYMQDGQNLFDDNTSYVGEWHVDETLNNLYDEGIKVPIVVGIDNGGLDRIDEYSPWINSQYGGGKGDEYVSFLVETLKPYIDEHYRTLQNRESTGIMGSSLGALISHYGTIKYQNVFSKAGLFSPSYWFSDSVFTFTENTGKADAVRFYLMCGGNEGDEMAANMNSMASTLETTGFNSNNIITDVVAGGEHNETLWGEQFGKAYQWLFKSWINTIPKNRVSENLSIYPNPVEKLVQFPKEMRFGPNDSLILSDAAGKTLLEIDSFKGDPMPVCGLTPGVYFITIKSTKTVYTGQFIKN